MKQEACQSRSEPTPHDDCRVLLDLLKERAAGVSAFRGAACNLSDSVASSLPRPSCYLLPSFPAASVLSATPQLPCLRAAVRERIRFDCRS
eukprot:593636-Amphidinium_carterae.2